MLGLLELALRDTPGDDPGAGVEMGDAVAQDGAPDGDRGVQVAIVAEVADGAAVEAAPLALQLPDQLHGAHLGGAGERAGGEDGAERVEGVEVGSQAALDVADQVQDVAVALDRAVARHRHRARPRNAPHVVAPQVDEHDVLGVLLGVARQLVGDRRVLGGVAAARPGAGDRVGRQAVALHLEEELGAGADDLEGAGPDEEEVGARVDPPERTVEGEAVEGGPP